MKIVINIHLDYVIRALLPRLPHCTVRPEWRPKGEPHRKTCTLYSGIAQIYILMISNDDDCDELTGAALAPLGVFHDDYDDDDGQDDNESTKNYDDDCDGLTRAASHPLGFSHTRFVGKIIMMLMLMMMTMVMMMIIIMQTI